MANSRLSATSRLKQDYLHLKRDPVPYISAEPMPSNILEWHYVVQGPEDSPYHGGYYHGTLLFTTSYPFTPPSIYMQTPNGRFKTNTRLCLSNSDFHPDKWNPAWSVSTILTGLLSFMLETTPTWGATETTIYEKQQYAKKSLDFNLKDDIFCELFPDVCKEIRKTLTELPEQQPLNANNGLDTKNVDGGDLENKKYVNKYEGNSSSNLVSNLIVIIAFILFALLVHVVMKNLKD